MDWFTVDKEGLAALLERKGKARVLPTRCAAARLDGGGLMKEHGPECTPNPDYDNERCVEHGDLIRDEWAESLSDALLDFGIDNAQRDVEQTERRYREASTMLERLTKERARRASAKKVSG